jgi:hypothetical protein
MIRRLLARLRYADGGPVVEQSAPPEPGAHSAAHAAREGEIADIDAQMWEAWRRSSSTGCWTCGWVSARRSRAGRCR